MRISEARPRAIAHLRWQLGLVDLGVGAALSVEGYVPNHTDYGKDDSVAIAADAFVTVGF